MAAALVRHAIVVSALMALIAMAGYVIADAVARPPLAAIIAEQVRAMMAR